MIYAAVDTPTAAILIYYPKGGEGMASSTGKVTVSGIPLAQEGDDWFLIDQSGSFSLDKNIVATIWLVGGGCDGTAGVWNGNEIDSSYEPIPDTGTGISYSGSGGDGGYVLILNNIKIPKNKTFMAVIAESNDKSGTSLDLETVSYKCNQSGSILRAGGKSGSLPLPSAGSQFADQSTAVISTSGLDGIETPYGFVGSSGGGGAVCNGISSASNGVVGGNGAGDGKSHRDAGTDADNYGCGGGGGAICGRIAEGQNGGSGKQGCIIISYVIEESTLVVQKHYKRVCNTKNTYNTDYYSNNSKHSCCSNTECGCGCNDGNTNSDYTDTVRVNTVSGLKSRIESLTSELESANAERIALQSKIDELQAKLDSITST